MTILISLCASKLPFAFEIMVESIFPKSFNSVLFNLLIISFVSVKASNDVILESSLGSIIPVSDVVVGG